MTKFISIDQVRWSLERLSGVHPFFGMSFLAFKKENIPVGSSAHVSFTQVTTDLLEKYYRPSPLYKGYYNPFQTSKAKDNRWTKPRYPSTSLQRITADTFSDALIHRKNTSDWGWKPEYISKLKSHLSGELIPTFSMAAWLYRTESLPSGTSAILLNERFFDDFSITRTERRELFETTAEVAFDNWYTNSPISELELFRVIGNPPGMAPDEGAALRSLNMRAIGPASDFTYQPSERLNIITGDNSLGKTFLLECIWWALTGDWLERPALPRPRSPKGAPNISYEIGTAVGKPFAHSSDYSWEQQAWTLPNRRSVVAGLVIYARFDGSYAVWDPARLSTPEAIDKSPKETRAKKILFSRDAIWEGIQNEGRSTWTSNGLLRDWISWQTRGGRFEQRWNALVASLQKLSPADQALEPGEPVKLPFNELEVPTIQMSYGEVPVTHASAGIQRAITLAYILVWSWFTHLDNSEATRREPQRRLVLLVDEAEAHLHPRWQRTIVPSLMSVLAHLAPLVAPQIHIATHSPLVMASIESIFDENRDDLHHLRLARSGVILEELPFVKRGRADLWLMSDVFGLAQARSQPAEEAITSAVALQKAAIKLGTDISPLASRIREVNDRLESSLAQDDDFWPRWRYFAEPFL